MPWLLHIPNDMNHRRPKLAKLFSNDQSVSENHPITIKQPVQLLDLFPTLVKLTGLGSPLKKCNKSLVILNS